MEYESSCWDPYRKCHIDAFQKIQRRVAKFINPRPGHGYEKIFNHKMFLENEMISPMYQEIELEFTL